MAETAPGLLSTAALAAALDDEALRIYDCTTYLHLAAPEADVPYHPEPGRADYDRGHLPGAGFVDVPSELSDPYSPYHFMCPPPARFAAVMGCHGVGPGTRVVLYSRGSPMWATRVWWLLHAFGFDDAWVLDGGIEQWIREGHPLDREPCRYPSAQFVARPRPGRFVDRTAMLAAQDDPATLVINTLSPAAFRGEGPSRYGRPGRIPGSVNLPHVELTDPERGTFLPMAEIAAKLEAIGADRAKQVIAYCGGGISATMALFLLHGLGHRNLALYDASMSEWARDPTLPIERG